MNFTNDIKVVLFDLDGTLLDTYPDLMLAANHVLSKLNYPLLDNITARKLATDGMIAMLKASMKQDIDLFSQEELKKMFLDFYSTHIKVNTKLFDGIEELLNTIRQKKLKWGIVTNKPSFLTIPLLEQMPELNDCAVVITSDMMVEKKPHPKPLLEALKKIDMLPSQAIYVGDHIRDIECGNNAKTFTIAASWGYIDKNDDISLWKANFIANNPFDIIKKFFI